MMKTLASLVLFAPILFPAELPVRQVILYKHGIGYFERSGNLAAGESARLEFKASEMNDVLKSLTIREQSGGKISGLRYDSMDLPEQRLAEFPFKLGDAQALSSVMDQLKGARLEMQFGNQTVSGIIVGARLAPGDEKRPEKEQVTLMLDAGELRGFDLSAATGLRFSDPKLQQQFRDYLAVLTAARSQDKRSVYIDSTDAKARNLVANYTIPSAIWKSSYRLVLDTSQATLEGWAIVDNTTGEDWTRISLSLVSGRPISFISQLYAARYGNRPTAELPEDRAVAPVIHEGVYVESGAGGGVIGGIIGGVPPAAPPPPPARAAAPQTGRFARQDLATAEDRSSTVANNTISQTMGELFEYRLPQPVTIRKGESAMLPFLQEKIDARKLLIYTKQGSGHPSNAAELSNSSGKTLDGGPLTIYDGGAYAGEALMETLKSGDKRLISYAVDLGTRITEAFDSKGTIVRELHANRGILTLRVTAAETTTYTIRNVDQKAKTLIIEHPARPEYTVLGPKPAEKTSSAHRFEVKLDPGATQTLPVPEERVYHTSYAVSGMTPDDLLSYVSNKSLGEAGRKQLEQIANQKNRLAATDQQLRDVEKQISDATADEDRLRKNIESLNQVSSQQQLVQEYAGKLAAQERQLAALRDRQADLQKERTQLSGEVNRLIASLSF